MQAPRIRFIIPYFGRWPFWMPFFLETCRHNPDIDWLFFSDCGEPEALPENVKIRACSFGEYCLLVSKRLGIDFSPENPYKLCDIKPALGYVHADELEDVDFWGFSDIDLIYGNLRDYFTAERLARFDLLSTHERRISGHLCLMRNTAQMRELFMMVTGWREKFSSQQHLAFDEAAFARLFIRRKNWPGPLRRFVDLFNPLRRRSEFKEAFSTPDARIAWHDGRPGFPERWNWRKGRLVNDRDGAREFPYFHFITWKSKVWPALPATQLLPDMKILEGGEWSVTAEGFRPI